jgi:hypothetical protein
VEMSLARTDASPRFPDMRRVNAATGTNWEGVGVKSDVVVEKGNDARALVRWMAMEVLGFDDTGVSAQAQVL